MKKVFAVILALAVLLVCAGALAAGRGRMRADAACADGYGTCWRYEDGAFGRRCADGACGRCYVDADGDGVCDYAASCAGLGKR